MTDGLEGVIAAETTISDVDGARGRLILRGQPIEALSGRAPFEAVADLLLEPLLAPEAGRDRVSDGLGEARVRVFRRAKSAEPDLWRAPAYDAVRAIVARLPDDDAPETALELIAAPAVVTAAAQRLARGLEPVEPDPAASHAADTLTMLRGAAPGPGETRALDAYLVTVADHGLNASTFAARVVASTRAGLTSSALAGLSALKGPLHGGAPGPVIDMLDEIGAPEAARAWLEAAVARGDRLMGFGHRVYRVRDPRADALKAALGALTGADRGPDARLALAEAVEAAALEVLKARQPGRRLETNVEFYTALLLERLGFAPELFTCVFAMGRTAGWIAHALEQKARGRLIRPLSRYVGPAPEPAAA